MNLSDGWVHDNANINFAAKEYVANITGKLQLMKTIPSTERQVCLNSLIFTYLHFLNKVIKLLPTSGKRRCHEKWLWSIRIFF